MLLITSHYAFFFDFVLKLDYWCWNFNWIFFVVVVIVIVVVVVVAFTPEKKNIIS
jgi:hypothetical protein